MLEAISRSVIFYSHYTTDGVSETGLTVTIDVYEVTRDGTKTQVVTDGACTEIGDGLYRYILAAGSVDAEAEYVGVFHTATDTVDQQDIPAMWVINRANVEDIDDILTDTAAMDTTIMGATVEGTYSVQEVLRIMVGVLAGKLSGGGTTTLTFRDLSDSLDRVVATVDSSGNRSAITITET